MKTKGRNLYYILFFCQQPPNQPKFTTSQSGYLPVIFKAHWYCVPSLGLSKAHFILFHLILLNEIVFHLILSGRELCYSHLIIASLKFFYLEALIAMQFLTQFKNNYVQRQNNELLSFLVSILMHGIK